MLRPLTACFVFVSVCCIATDGPDYRVGALARLEPQPIYSSDLRDSWNRIFFLLFTRRVETRLTDDFRDAGPWEAAEVMGSQSLQLTMRTVERIESGDRAIDPLYPNFFSSKGSEPILNDPGFTELKQALQEACAETAPRPPIQRALMQADVWAAYEIVSWSRRDDGAMGDHARILLPLLAQFIAKLALTDKEIAALPHNYLAAQSAQNLPHLFVANSGWMEVEWFPGRSHDEMSENRHAARIFFKPVADPEVFLNDVNRKIRKHDDPLPEGIRSLDGAALITQVLLIDRQGRVVPSPLISDLQLRTVSRDRQKNFKASAVEEYELSRQLILKDPSSGGFVHRAADEPTYLPNGGNDFTFAPPMTTGREPKPPILGTLRRRCDACHFEGSVFTFQMIQIPGRRSPPLRILHPDADERALYVANKKMESKSFKALQLGRAEAP
jgi:hypothetical protein